VDIPRNWQYGGTCNAALRLCTILFCAEGCTAAEGLLAHDCSSMFGELVVAAVFLTVRQDVDRREEACQESPRKAVVPGRAVRVPRTLASGKPTLGFLAGTMKVGPDFDPAAPAFAAAEWGK
jgi:hypothetical protein